MNVIQSQQEVMIMTNRQLAALETKRKLMEAAKELISKKGLANTSIAEIIKKCGVPTGLFTPILNRKKTSCSR